MKNKTNVVYLSERSTTFTFQNGHTINRGDAVAVADTKGTWRLSYVYRNQPVLYGGELGYGELRSFAVERLSIPKKKITRNFTEQQRQAMAERMDQVRASRKTKVSA